MSEHQLLVLLVHLHQKVATLGSREYQIVFEFLGFHQRSPLPLAIDLTIRLGTLSDSSLVARKIGSGRRLLCASTTYLNNAGPLKQPSDLEKHNCLTFRSNPGSNIWKFKDGKGALSGVSVTGNLYANDGESLVAAAVLGHGIILVPEWLVACELKEGTLQEILINYKTTPKETPMYALYPRQRHLPPKVRAFIDFLVDQFDNT